MRLVFAFALLAVAALATDAKGKEFLEKKKNEAGVIAMPSGLLYKVIRKGHGLVHPTVDAKCDTHYEGTLIDGTKFDSSYDRGSPLGLAPNQVIKGWTEAMQLMVEGDKWELYIPSELAYGASGSPPTIPGDAALVFTMEMVKIQGNTVPAVKCDPTKDDLPDCNDDEKAFIAKAKGWDAPRRKEQSDRLTKMQGASMAAEKKAWVGRRVKILRQLVEADEKSA
eukprot:TRINITY_DN67461_c0_g1_i1.p1 TRINITY_DN67461_c0_g1~~TRINITY_DN67461_c0_g1_i1.p1  ORF type:complete len:224 (-),score=52.02 TRINITY_DN67461_c0_g1_i1:260-931(-)